VTRSISLHLLAFHTQKIIASDPRPSGSGGSCRRGSNPSLRRDFLGAGLGLLQRRARPDAGEAACSAVAEESGPTSPGEVSLVPGHAGPWVMMFLNSSRVFRGNDGSNDAAVDALAGGITVSRATDAPSGDIVGSVVTASSYGS
jgi:hypothetical protein